MCVCVFVCTYMIFPLGPTPPRPTPPRPTHPLQVFPEWGVIKLEQDQARCLTCRSFARHCVHCKSYLGEGISEFLEVGGPMTPQKFEKKLQKKLDKERGCYMRLSHSKQKLPFWPDDTGGEFEHVKLNYEGEDLA